MVDIMDPEQKEFDLKLSKTIENMPEEVRDRFKALKVLQDEANELDEEEDKEYRDLELKYDKLYKQIYEERRRILVGEAQPAEALISDYEKRAQELQDEDYKKLEVQSCDVKDIQNTPTGVYGFWMRAMLNHGSIGRMIFEKDRPILMHLQDVECVLHSEGYGFDLFFRFEKNDYFNNAELKKSFTMSKQNVIEKCEGTDIEWRQGKDVTKKQVKKKSKNKKAAQKTITKTVEQESFFNFFKTLEMPDEEKLKEKKDIEGEEEEKDLGEKMDMDFDIGNEFKDQLIPLALEYYMEVIDEDDEEGDSCHSGDGHGHHHHGKDDSDDDEQDNKKTKGKKGGAKKEGGAPAGDQKECKQQ